LLVLPLFYQNELLGILSAHYTNGHEITDSEINIIKNIGNQAVLAIHRANLYEMNQAQLKKAEATKKIIEASRKSLELEVLLSDICKELAELFKFQRATIGQLIRETPEESVAVGEYIYNKNIKSYKSHSGFGEIIKYWSSYLMREKKTKIVNDISNSDMPAKVAQIYKEIGINSIACIPLRSEENMIWGGMFLSEKEDNRNVIEENLEFLETVGSQIYIAIRQAELYKKEKEALERESLLRKITSAIRSTLDIDELEKIIVEKIAKALRADRCFIIAYDDETNKFLPVKT
ncbi:MAG TPA: GAF domain-containing protein, partial [Candidatus Gastranaerophilaceae bacterium]|nr:GAF domain-containing protein [Candidatus Gastranaerophilaceae bacterium]